MTDSQSKRCPRCDTVKPIDKFGRNRSRSDGRQVYCRECANAYLRAYMAENPEQRAKSAARNAEYQRRPEVRPMVNAKRRRHYWKDPEASRAASRAAYKLDPESSKKKATAWTKANKDRVNARRRARRLEQSAAERGYRHRRRARLARAGVYSVTERDWFRLCVRYNHRCAYCGSREPLTQDHIIPIVRGGRHSIGNLLPACKSCNCSKHSRLIVEWRAIARRSEQRSELSLFS